jgi:hypothetical protein
MADGRAATGRIASFHAPLFECWGCMMQKKYQYDVALSFAGEDRHLAEYLARRLQALGLRVFYDGFERATLWGRNLYENLHHIYSDKAEYCILIISEYYVSRKWTRKEWHSAQERALRQPEDYLLPIRLDNSELPGLSDAIAYLDAREIQPDEIVGLLLHKIACRLKAGSRRLTPEVAISGSHPDNALHSLCRELGKKLLVAGFRIVSGGTENVGYQVSLGAYNYLQSRGANFYDKRDLIVTYTNENFPGFPPVKFGTPIPVTQPEVELYRSEFIDRVNLVLSISGKDGTWKEYLLAKALGKPVLPLAATGGSAMRIWEDIQRNLDHLYAGQITSLEFAQLAKLNHSRWEYYLNLVTSLAKKLVKHPNETLSTQQVTAHRRKNARRRVAMLGRPHRRP